MENNNLKLKIDKQIKELIEKINSNNSEEEIKGSQIMLNNLLNKYLKEK